MLGKTLKRDLMRDETRPSQKISKNKTRLDPKVIKSQLSNLDETLFVLFGDQHCGQVWSHQVLTSLD